MTYVAVKDGDNTTSNSEEKVEKEMKKEIKMKGTEYKEDTVRLYDGEEHVKMFDISNLPGIDEAIAWLEMKKTNILEEQHSKRTSADFVFHELPASYYVYAATNIISQAEYILKYLPRPAPPREENWRNHNEQEKVSIKRECIGVKVKTEPIDSHEEKSSKEGGSNQKALCEELSENRLAIRLVTGSRFQPYQRKHERNQRRSSYLPARRRDGRDVRGRESGRQKASQDADSWIKTRDYQRRRNHGGQDRSRQNGGIQGKKPETEKNRRDRK